MSYVMTDVMLCLLTHISASCPPSQPPQSLCSGCYLAGSQYSRHAVAVSQRELDLDVDPPRSLSRDPHGPQPVVLAGAHHITDLIHS